MYKLCKNCSYCMSRNGIHICENRKNPIIPLQDMYIPNNCMVFNGDLTSEAYQHTEIVPNPGERNCLMYLCPKCHSEIIHFLNCVDMNDRASTIGHCNNCNSDFELSKLIEQGSPRPLDELLVKSSPVPSLFCDPEHVHEVKADDTAYHPAAYETIGNVRELLSPSEFTGFCLGNVLQRISKWREDGGINELREAAAYLNMAIENEEKPPEESNG